MKRAAPVRRGERGAAAVEFALVAPLLFLVLFAIISYGYMLSYRQALSQGSAEGARAAAVLPSGSSSDSKVAAAVAALNQTLNTYGVSCSISTGATTGNLMRGTTAVGTCEVSVRDCATATTSSANLSGVTPDCMRVYVMHRYATYPLIPSFPGLGYVLPDNLAYTAIAQVSS